MDSNKKYIIRKTANKAINEIINRMSEHVDCCEDPSGQYILNIEIRPLDSNKHRAGKTTWRIKPVMFLISKNEETIKDILE